MKLERLNSNKIKIFLTFDDLIDRGLSTEDIKENSLKIHKLFQDMIEEACDELSFKMIGSVAIEIFSLQAQGLIIIVTRDEEDLLDNEDEDEFLDLRVKMGENPDILYLFKEIDDVIQFSHRLNNIEPIGSSLYSYNNHYYLLIEEVPEESYHSVISLAAEYGYASTMTLCKVQEYAKTIVVKTAFQTIRKHFKTI